MVGSRQGQESKNSGRYRVRSESTPSLGAMMVPISTQQSHS